jgi:hypothetical protein
MTRAIAATLILIYVLSSAGIVLVEYSCAETGTNGVSMPAPKSCYAPSCDDEDGDDVCCELSFRDTEVDDQLCKDNRSAVDDVATASPIAVAVTRAAADIPSATDLCSPSPPHTGFSRPLRI